MFHPDFIQAGLENLYLLLRRPKSQFNYTKIRDRESNVVQTKHQLNSPLQIWLMNTWNNWFLKRQEKKFWNWSWCWRWRELVVAQIDQQRRDSRRKIGSVMEMTTYKSVCKSITAVIARRISALHGIYVIQHSDIHIYLEDIPNLPLHTDFGDSETHAQKAIKHVINC